ncbi:putative galactose-proton symport [Stipitochalara longipes BDJ]|nr:putative galactose-proton symport [Stipitochalara longipes BDJ]
MAAPLTPDWVQPSHPSIQKVLTSNASDFTTKSISLVTLPPYALYAKLSFPPCTTAAKPTYATVQTGRDEHMSLNSDLVYINHSCAPSVIFDTASFSILAGPNGLKEGEELTFFYPSTEWDMAQGFSCFCGAETCRGYISGAKNMKPEQLEGVWLNAHIRVLLEERDAAQLPENGSAASAVSGNVTAITDIQNGIEATRLKDATEEALKSALDQARKMVDAAQKALDTYKSIHGRSSVDDLAVSGVKGANRQNGVGSREMSGEMGGDTLYAV